MVPPPDHVQLVDRTSISHPLVDYGEYQTAHSPPPPPPPYIIIHPSPRAVPQAFWLGQHRGGGHSHPAAMSVSDADTERSDSTHRWRQKRSPSSTWRRKEERRRSPSRSPDEAYRMNMYLSDDTVVPRYTPPTKGKYWDFAVAAVAESTDESVWKFPNNVATIMMIDGHVQPPHGVLLHRLIQKDADPFSHSIAVAVKDTLHQVASHGSLEWPSYTKWSSRPGNQTLDSSRCCPGVHRVRLSLRTECFFDKMPEYIDVGIVVAAERLSPVLWEDAAEHCANCSVRVVTTRGGGGVNEPDMFVLAVARVFAKAVDTVMDTMDASDSFTMVGHSTRIPSELTVKGKKMSHHEALPMLWMRCHHSVKLKGKDKGKAKGKGQNKDKGKAKGKGKGQNKDKGKAKGKGKLNDRGGGK